MKIALFSDIHANLPALQACLASIDSQKPDVIYCLGDLVGYNVWPNEVINEIRNRGIPTIAGNYDEGIGLASDECGCAYKTTEDRERGKMSISYTNAIISPGGRNYLSSLPAQISITYKLGKEKINLLLVHGSPRKNNEYLFEDRDEKSLLRIMTDANAHIMCFGHTHQPFHRILSSDTDTASYRHAINIGSVGKPKDGDPRGCYAILHITDQSTMMDKDSIQVEFMRFAYDVEAAAVAIENSPLPNEFADMLRQGR